MTVTMLLAIVSSRQLSSTVAGLRGKETDSISWGMNTMSEREWKKAKAGRPINGSGCIGATGGERPRKRKRS